MAKVCRFRSPVGIGNLPLIGNKSIRRHLARAILVDRAVPDDMSIIGRIARARSEENYRFAGQFVASKAVLDVGGGTGIGHDLLLEKGASSLQSIDKHVASESLRADPRISSIRGDFLSCPLGDETFDVVVCLGTLFYLQEGDAAIAKMHRVLRPNGILIINCINQQLVRRYFGLALDQIDGKFSAAHDEIQFCALLARHFGTVPAMYVQQPVLIPRTVLSSLAFWLTPLVWPFRRHPVLPKPSGTEGMYVYAIARKGSLRSTHAC
jgi:SAM-dependent methyltransferase